MKAFPSLILFSFGFLASKIPSFKVNKALYLGIYAFFSLRSKDEKEKFRIKKIEKERI